jgi:hypothetical protein
MLVIVVDVVGKAAVPAVIKGTLTAKQIVTRNSLNLSLVRLDKIING